MYYILPLACENEIAFTVSAAISATDVTEGRTTLGTIVGGTEVSTGAEDVAVGSNGTPVTGGKDVGGAAAVTVVVAAVTPRQEQALSYLAKLEQAVA